MAVRKKIVYSALKALWEDVGSDKETWKLTKVLINRTGVVNLDWLISHVYEQVDAQEDLCVTLQNGFQGHHGKQSPWSK